MDVNDLLNGQCKEYAKGSPTLTEAEVKERLPLVPDWELIDGKGLRLSQRLADFQSVIDFINEAAVVAEEQQHHPDFWVHSYRSLQIDLSTHSIGGLTDNDFIMAAKLDQLRK